MTWSWSNFHLVEAAVESSELPDAAIHDIIEAITLIDRDPLAASAQAVDRPGRPTAHLFDLPHGAILVCWLFRDGVPPSRKPTIVVKDCTGFGT